ncbi:glycosyltransferase [Paenibacillus herberti]|nr:glycosyltransferase family 2 protein [Paenibacillus herberti]
MAVLLAVVSGLLVLQLGFVLWNCRYYFPLGDVPDRGSDGRGTTSSLSIRTRYISSDQLNAGSIIKNNTKNYKVLPNSISILIPARNEERNIGSCLESLLALPEPPLEILVLDDHSEDRTAAITQELAARPGSRIRLLKGRKLPEGWMGKSHACVQLAEAAKGRWLLFLDADVRLEPEALRAAVRAAQAQGRGLISGFPRQETETWMEKLVVSMMMFTILCHLPLKLVSGSRDPRFAAANGAFILIHSDSYLGIGGHGAVRSSLLDDMELIRLAKRSGEPVRLAKIDGISSMRMYRNAAEVWAGYRKNLFPGMGRSLTLLIFVFSVYTALYLLPTATLIGGLVAAVLTGSAMPVVWLGWATMAWALGALIKLTVDRSSGLPAWYSLLLPASIALTVWIGLDSARQHYRKKGYEWKGRRYA